MITGMVNVVKLFSEKMNFFFNSKLVTKINFFKIIIIFTVLFLYPCSIFCSSEPLLPSPELIESYKSSMEYFGIWRKALTVYRVTPVDADPGPLIARAHL